MTVPTARPARGAAVATACHVAVLCAFAVAQPLYDVLGRNATFFVAHAASIVDLGLLVAAVSLAVPAVLLVAGGLVRLVAPRVGGAAPYAAVATLVALAALPPLYRAGASDGAALAAAGAAGGVAAAAYARLAPVRQVLTVLAPSVAVFPALFLLASPVSRLVLARAPVAAEGVVVGRPAPVVLVVFDGLGLTALLDGEGGIDDVRYPNFAALARDATWYRNATTVADHTMNAVPAILTGQYPVDPFRVPVAAEHPENLFVLLGSAFELNVHEKMTALCPEWLCRRVTRRDPLVRRLAGLLRDAAVVYAHVVVPPGRRDALLPTIEGRWRDFGAAAAPVDRGHFDARGAYALIANRADDFAAGVAGIAARPRPTLHFFHVLLPHTPFEYLPTGRVYPVPDRLTGVQPGGWRSEALATEAERRYLLQVGFVDRLLGQLLDRLHATGLYDAALVVVTADHGMAFQPDQPHRLVTKRNLHDLLWVPLFVKAPGRGAGRVSDAAVETIDIVPTVADVLDVALPWQVDGASALGEARRAERMLVSRAGRRRFPADIPGRQDVVAARIARLGARSPWSAVFRRSLHGDLLDRRLADLSLQEDAPYTVQLWDGAAYDHVGGSGRLVPALVQGWVRASDGGAAPREVAIAVNDTIGATTATSPEPDGRFTFSAMVEERRFRPGANTVDVLVVRPGEAGDVRLARARPARRR